MRYTTLTTAAPLSLLLLATLAGCGESDLEELHASEIAAAREAAGEGGTGMDRHRGWILTVRVD